LYGDGKLYRTERNGKSPPNFIIVQCASLHLF
jgi:hypothetical protein